jgi:polysaccharide biosynthesis protein PelA
VSISSRPKRPLAVFYGSGELDALQGFRRVVLQPLHYSDDALAALRAAGTAPLAYLSLGEDVVGEDTGAAAPWRRPERNTAWYGHYVRAAHPDWLAHLRKRAEALVARGFAGFLLDTLDTVDLFPEDRSAYLELVAALRQVTPTGYLLANRGFSLLPELSEYLDGLLFEAFSSTWSTDGGTGALAPADLMLNTERVNALEGRGLDLYALDYADTPALEAFARDRARSHGLASLIGNRELTRL